MNILRFIRLSSVFLLAILPGCEKQAVEHSVTQSPEAYHFTDSSDSDRAVAAFKKLVAGMMTTVAYTNPSDKAVRLTQFSSISYDVQRTDSLISPFSGYVSFSLNETDLNGGDSRTPQLGRAIFAWQEGQWRYKGIKFEGGDFLGSDDPWAKQMEQAFHIDRQNVRRGD
jgi:hypothetical protein